MKTRLPIPSAITILAFILISGVLIRFCHHGEQEQKKRAENAEKPYSGARKLENADSLMRAEYSEIKYK